MRRGFDRLAQTAREQGDCDLVQGGAVFVYQSGRLYLVSDVSAPPAAPVAPGVDSALSALDAPLRQRFPPRRGGEPRRGNCSPSRSVSELQSAAKQ